MDAEKNIAEMRAEKAAMSNGQKDAPHTQTPTLWASTKRYMRLILPRSTYQEYILPSRVMASTMDLDGGHCEFTIGVPTAHHQQWMRGRMQQPLKQGLSDTTGCPIDGIALAFVLADEYEAAH